MSNAALAFRAPPEIHEAVQAAAARAGVDRSAWLLEAVTWALENDQLPAHVPRAVKDATPRRNGSRMIMPVGRIYDRFPK